MRNCLILGFGRSGTSMMGGILHQAGYYMGDHLYPPRQSNPKGFYEDKEINRINEMILENYDGIVKRDQDHDYKLYSPYKPRFGHRWLSFIPFDTNIECNNPELINEIIHYTGKQPFAYKDPRFCFTLDVWSEYLKTDTLILVMLRDPFATVQSVLDECDGVNYLKDFAISRQLAIDLWVNYYKRVQQLIDKNISKILIVDYDKLIAGKALNKISEMLGVSLKNDFIEPALNRSSKINHNKVYNGFDTEEMLTLFTSLST